jgi:hypothetical protein
MAGDAIQVFDGTPTTVLTQTADLVTANFSTAATYTVTEFDNSTDLWPMARCSLLFGDSTFWNAAPTVGTTIDIYICPRDLSGGTTDVTVPTTTLVNGAQYAGSFSALYATDEAQPLQAVISLLGIEKCTFAIFNSSGASIDWTDGGNNVTVEGFTFTPSA